MSQFYRTIRQGVGDAVLMGCNTVGHLGAGIFELQRIGDDTSGRDWNRTRKMGVNTLAFRLPQHPAFFLAGPRLRADLEKRPDGMTRQWMELVAKSGAGLFISADPAKVTPEEKDLLKSALTTAAEFPPQAEPLDWMETTAPERWRLGDKTARFTWFGKEGVDPFAKG